MDKAKVRLNFDDEAADPNATAPENAVLSPEELVKKIKEKVIVPPMLAMSIATDGTLSEGSSATQVAEFHRLQEVVVELLNSDMPQGVPEAAWSKLHKIKDKALRGFLTPYIQGTYIPVVIQQAEAIPEVVLSPEELVKKIKEKVIVPPMLAMSIATDGTLSEGSSATQVAEFHRLQEVVVELLNSDMPQGVPEAAWSKLHKIKDKALRGFLTPYIQGTYIPVAVQDAEATLEETVLSEEAQRQKLEQQDKENAGTLLDAFMRVLYQVEAIYAPDAKDAKITDAQKVAQKEALENATTIANMFFRKNMTQGISEAVWEQAKLNQKLASKSEGIKRAFECFFKDYREGVYEPVDDAQMSYQRPQMFKRLAIQDYDTIKKELVLPLQDAWGNMLKQGKHTVISFHKAKYDQFTKKLEQLRERNVDVVFASYNEPDTLPESEVYTYAVPKAVQLMSFTTEKFDPKHQTNLSNFRGLMQEALRDNMQSVVESAALMKDGEKFFIFTSPIANADVYGEKQLKEFEAAYDIVIAEIGRDVPASLSSKDPFAFELDNFHAAMTLETVENKQKREVHTALNFLRGNVTSQEGLTQVIGNKYLGGNQFQSFWKELCTKIASESNSFKKPSYKPEGNLESQVSQFRALINLDTAENQHRMAIQQSVKGLLGEGVNIEDKQEIASLIRQKYTEQEDPFGRFLSEIQGRLAKEHPFRTQARSMPAISDVANTVIAQSFPGLEATRKEELKNEVAKKFRSRFISKQKAKLKEGEKAVTACIEEIDALEELQRNGTVVTLVTELYEEKPPMVKAQPAPQPPQPQEKKEEKISVLELAKKRFQSLRNVMAPDEDNDNSGWEEDEPVKDKPAKDEPATDQVPPTPKSREQLEAELDKVLQDRDRLLMGSFEIRVEKMVESVFSPSLSSEQREEALNAINKVLENKGQPIFQTTDTVETIKEKLPQLIRPLYPDNEAFLQDVRCSQVKLSDNNPLKVYKSLQLNTIEAIMRDYQIEISPLKACGDEALTDTTKTIASDNNSVIRPTDAYITLLEQWAESVENVKQKEALTARIAIVRAANVQNKWLIDHVSKLKNTSAEGARNDSIEELKTKLSIKQNELIAFTKINGSINAVMVKQAKHEADIVVNTALLETLESNNYQENRFLAISDLLPPSSNTQKNPTAEEHAQAVSNMFARVIVEAIQGPKLAEMQAAIAKKPWYATYIAASTLEEYNNQAEKFITAADEKVESFRIEALALSDKCVKERRERLKLGYNDLSQETQEELEGLRTKILLCPQFAGSLQAYAEANKDIKGNLALADQKIEVVSTDGQQQIDALVLMCQKIAQEKEVFEHTLRESQKTKESLEGDAESATKKAQDYAKQVLDTMNQLVEVLSITVKLAVENRQLKGRVGELGEFVEAMLDQPGITEVEMEDWSNAYYVSQPQPDQQPNSPLPSQQDHPGSPSSQVQAVQRLPRTPLRSPVRNG